MADSREQIERLILLYAERIDAGDFQGLADLLADAVVKAAGRVLADGRGAVLRLYETTTRRYEDGTPHTKHVVTNVIIEVDETADTAAARSYFTVFQQLPDFPLQPIIAGRYLDHFIRENDGWRFTEREITPEIYGNLSRHLLVDLRLT